MDKARGGTVLLVVALCVVGVGGIVALRSHKAPTAGPPVGAVVTTTLPYNPRPGPGGTKVLTEPVDPLSLAVPGSWVALPADAITLPAELNGLAAQEPPLAPLLHAAAQVEVKAAIRLFAFEPGPVSAFVWVLSYSSPGVDSLTPSQAAAFTAAAKAASPGAVISGQQLPVGLALRVYSSGVTAKHRVDFELLTVIAHGRTMLVSMATETDTKTPPALFDQIARSIRVS